jgi:hypothetical protein
MKGHLSLVMKGGFLDSDYFICVVKLKSFGRYEAKLLL